MDLNDLQNLIPGAIKDVGTGIATATGAVKALERAPAMEQGAKPGLGALDSVGVLHEGLSLVLPSSGRSGIPPLTRRN